MVEEELAGEGLEGNEIPDRRGVCVWETRLGLELWGGWTCERIILGTVD